MKFTDEVLIAASSAAQSRNQGADMTERQKILNVLIDHLSINGNAPIASPDMSPGRRLADEIYLALTGARIPRNISHSDAVEAISAKTGEALGRKEINRLTLNPKPMWGQTMDTITSGSVSLKDAARVFTFARDSGEINWEIIHPKNPDWAFYCIQHEIGKKLSVRSPADSEYARELPSIVMRYTWQTGVRGGEVYDARLGSEQADSYSALVLAYDPGDDAPTWRMLPEPLSYREIEKIVRGLLFIKEKTEEISAGEANLLKKDNDDLLALAARYEKIAPIVYHTLHQKDGSILLRQTNAQEGQPRVRHIWKNTIPKRTWR